LPHFQGVETPCSLLDLRFTPVVLGWISKFKDSVSLRIQDEAKYGQP